MSFDYPPSPPCTPTEMMNLPTPSNSTLKQSFSAKSMSIKEHVQVMVRCRPKSKKEMEEKACWIIDSRHGTIELAKITTSARYFNFDNVVMGEGNEQVYQAGIQKLVRSTMMGYNGTVFAYGQTASGKTYTMMGTEKEPGVIPRAVEEVFSYIEEDTSGRNYLLRVSYMEIYNERIKDLLASTDMHPDIVEDKKKGIYVRNLNEEIVKTPKEVMDCIQKGESNRHISATDYNDRSSRSHTIFQLVIESRQKSDESKTNSVQISQLNLIDLAGSEKVASDMERRKEGAFINKSLLTLGNVISKLTSDEPTTHIPFRNSKLTRILQASLSGNARISVICTINPTLASKDESLNTLKFAQRTKLVKTDAKMTKIGDNSQLQKCLRTIAELQIQMQEKNDIETETRNKLQNLLSIILTSSKESTRDHIDINFHSSTVDEVLAYCEENLLAKIESDRQTIQSMKVSIEQLQNKMRVMDDIVADKTEIVSRREVQIESLTEKQKVTIGHLKETANPALAHAFETFFLSTKPEEISQAKELIRQSLSKDGGQVFKEKRNESRELRLLSQKCKELVSENESLQKKMNKPVSIQEATLSVLPVFPMYRALVRQETLPELVEQVLEDCSSCHSTDDSFWDDRNDTESEVEEIVKTYEPYSQSIQQRVFYVPSSVIVAFIIYLLYQL